MWKYILAAIAAAVAILAGVIASQPEEFRVEQSIVIASSPEEVFPHVNRLRDWNAWSPWADIDPKATVVFSGPEEGEGASMSWNGNNEVGEGTITILESRPGEFLKYSLAFRRPMQDTSMAEFVLEPQAGGTSTKVTWSMYGKQDFLGKAMWFLFCERMMNEQFAKGLSSLKAVVESTMGGK